MTFPHLNRRTHLYLGLFLMPWFVIYGLSSIPFSHPAWGQAFYDDGVPQWTTRVDQDYVLPVPADGDLREIGAVLARAVGAKGRVGASRQGSKRISAYVYTFWTATQVEYDVEKQHLRAQDRRFRWDQWLTGVHGRGGYHSGAALDDGWAVTVDLASAGLLLWVATGIYMWWHLPRLRGWGWAALGAGFATFAVFLALL
jgi:hypothetical protein